MEEEEEEEEDEQEQEQEEEEYPLLNTHLISFFNFLVVSLIFNFQLFKVNEVQTIRQFLLGEMDN